MSFTIEKGPDLPAITSSVEAESKAVEARASEGEETKKHEKAEKALIDALGDFIKKVTSGYPPTSTGGISARGYVEHDSLNVVLSLTVSKPREVVEDKPAKKETK